MASSFVSRYDLRNLKREHQWQSKSGVSWCWLGRGRLKASAGVSEGEAVAAGGSEEAASDTRRSRAESDEA
jgi:hypothetical protein